MSIFRSPYNPIIEPKDVNPSRDDLEVMGVFNTGVTRYNNEVVLLLRVAERPIDQQQNSISIATYNAEKDDIVIKKFLKDDPEIDFSDPRLIITPDVTYLTSLSHLRLAYSKDGIKFKIEDTAGIFPANNYETFGLEDPRITLIDDTYYINYVALSQYGVTSCLVSTKDFNTFERLGIIFCPDNKDVTIFPEQVGGKYYALHRPSSPLFKQNEIWISESHDLICWGNHRHLMGPRKGFWDEIKIGAGAVPFRIEQGWLEIYHGVDKNNRYCLGAVLLDKDNPWKVNARSERPILVPVVDYEIKGFFGNVVFSCGLLYENNTLKIYYGAADTNICYAEITLQDAIRNLK